MTESIHVVDATMFWSATGGGVRRYLLTKHEWLARRPGWRHTIAVPGADRAAGQAELPAIALPGSGGYRLPLRRGAVARVLRDLDPDLIEAG
ncbi:MAG: glycosyltransferase family 1 protein, partial [Caldimonas sp.]